MTALGLQNKNRLLDMALDDVEKANRKDRLIAKDGNRRRHNRLRRDDFRRDRARSDYRGPLRKPLPYRSQPRPPVYVVKISNLDYTVTKDDLQNLLGSIGPIEKSWIEYDRTDRSTVSTRFARYML